MTRLSMMKAVYGAAIQTRILVLTIQEMTLTFVPKIIVIFLALLIFLPMMGALLNGFMQTIADRIVAG